MRRAATDGTANQFLDIPLAEVRGSKVGESRNRRRREPAARSGPELRLTPAGEAPPHYRARRADDAARELDWPGFVGA